MVLVRFFFFQDICLSQVRLSSESDQDKERYVNFQKKADEAGVVIMVLSKSFAKSKYSQQQV